MRTRGWWPSAFHLHRRACGVLGRAGLVVAMLLLSGRGARAGSDGDANGVRAAGAADGGVKIWYRTTDGCPDGSAFLARLRELGRNARLASVGDRVDFVVTLAAEAGSSAGRLERQTERGTVAIRELGAARCEEVAEALALSLELALEPASPGSSSEALAAPEPALSLSTAPALLPNGSASAAPDAAPTAPSARELTPDESPWRLGAQATLETGIAPGPSPGVALFVELGARGGVASARFSARGSYREARADGASLAVGLVAARLDGCAFGWRTTTWSVAPCLGADGGLISADSPDAPGRSDRGVWGSAFGLVRGSVRAGPHLFPEAEVGLGVPFTRYVFGGPNSGELFQTEAVLLRFALGVRWAL